MSTPVAGSDGPDLPARARCLTRQRSAPRAGARMAGTKGRKIDIELEIGAARGWLQRLVRPLRGQLDAR